MRTNKTRTSGFSIVEILIVLLIIGILTAAMLPNFNTYTNKARFNSVIEVAASYKGHVGACIQRNNGVLATCDNGVDGIPPATTVATANVAAGSGAVVNGVITATGTAAPGPGAFTYTLTPVVNADGSTEWTVGGTCLAAGLC